MTTIERLWNPIHTLSTEDNIPVELKFSGGDIHLGYFSSSPGRWVHVDGALFPEFVYPSHWRSPKPVETLDKARLDAAYEAYWANSSGTYASIEAAIRAYISEPQVTGAAESCADQ